MNDHLGQLQQALSDAATREYGARARSQSLRRWPPFALAALALAICATAGAAIVVLVDRAQRL